ncbi:MAG TPA: tetratricopeptide repeat protein, partial [Allocoleopsis sp.]
MKTEPVSGRKKNLWQRLLNPNRSQDLEHPATESASSLATAQDSISSIPANFLANGKDSLEACFNDNQKNNQSNDSIDTPDNKTDNSPAIGSVQSELQIGQPSHRINSLSWFEQSSFYLQQAVVSCSSGDWQDANTACQVVLEQLEPEAAKAYFILGRSLQAQQQFADAEQAYQKALLIQPNAETYARLASLHTAQRQFEAAITHYQEAIRLHPQFAG